jgi:hypothetical protein
MPIAKKCGCYGLEPGKGIQHLCTIHRPLEPGLEKRWDPYNKVVTHEIEAQIATQWHDFHDDGAPSGIKHLSVQEREAAGTSDGNRKLVHDQWFMTEEHRQFSDMCAVQGRTKTQTSLLQSQVRPNHHL